MKREMDLLRAILLSIENHEQEFLEQSDVQRGLLQQFPDAAWTDAQLVAHVRMLVEAKLVEAKFHSYYGEEDVFSRVRLTWEGHEFIIDASHEEVWETVKEKAGNFSFVLLKQALLEAAKDFLHLSAFLKATEESRQEA